MNPKSAVVKSKSTNGGVSNKKEKHKATRSDAEFYPLNTKKRGVYVDNKENNKLLNIHENNDAEIKKPPPRPRPGQKKFLTSVLTILSKSTTGTQYPDNDDAKAKKKTSNKIKRYNQETDIPDLNTEAKRKNKKHKYKSKVLNGENYMPFNDKLVVLQSKKDIVHTPSNFSENKSFSLCDSAIPIKDLLESNIYSSVADGLAKQILEGRSQQPVNQEELSTLVADSPKDDKKLYNFFVDLIETTFDVYNVETEQVDNKESNTLLEIEETVAKKLNFKIESPVKEETDLNFNIHEGIKDIDPNFNYVEDRPKMYKRKVPKQNILKTQSFIYNKPKFIPKSSSVVLKRKPQTKKSKKKDLLDMIKEELKMDFMTFEEPQNLYQALRNMAKYKRKCQEKKTIHFENDEFTPNKECVFSRGIFPIKKMKKRKNRDEKVKNLKQVSVTKITKQKKTPIIINASNHSLKVYGFQYEQDSFDRRQKYASFSDDDDFDPNLTIAGSESSLDLQGFYSLIQD